MRSHVVGRLLSAPGTHLEAVTNRLDRSIGFANDDAEAESGTAASTDEAGESTRSGTGSTHVSHTNGATDTRATRAPKEDGSGEDGRTDLRVLLVGPVRATGGIARYIEELRARLPERIAVDVYDTAAPEGSGTIRFVRGVLGALADACRFPLHDRPDVVHIHTAENFSFLRKSAYVLLTRYVWHRPVILHVHGPTFDRFVAEASLPLGMLQRIVFDASAAIVVLSPYWERALSPYLPAEKMVVLRNAIETDEYEPRCNAERAHVVFVSNHVPRKGIREFAAAIDRLLGSGADFRVSIAGSGPLDHYAEELAERYGNVEYLGYVSEERKRDLLCAASIYVLPAYAEGLPIGVLEGMAGGNAIVATAVGGIPDVVDDEGGKLVPPRDAEALTEALGSLVEAPKRACERGEHNVERVEAYTWSRVVPRLTDLYERVATDRSGSGKKDDGTGNDGVNV